MTLRTETLFGTEDKVEIALERIRTFEPTEGYYVAFSGGKDSCVILDLVKRAGVKFDAHYNLTTVDPPELVHFIRREHPEVEVHKPERTMWELIRHKGFPPTRTIRYCCSELKERGGAGRMVLTGVRWAESARRANRTMVEQCLKSKHKTYLHPIIDWSDGDVWNYIISRKLAYCRLYDEGWTRIGCVMCPMGGSGRQRRDSLRWPKIAEAYRRACVRAVESGKANERNWNWKNGDEMYEWWLSGEGRTDEDDDQGVLFE
jgi:phosphoadenosine phosphosulfate reductase